MPELTPQGRKRMPKEAFAIPKERKYPINDLAHARNALSRVAQSGTPEEQKRVARAVKKKFPQLAERSEFVKDTLKRGK